MGTALDSLQVRYLNNIKNAILEPPAILVEDGKLKEDTSFIEDYENFKLFLNSKGFNGNFSDFDLVIEKEQLFDFLKLQESNNCLAITDCFGLDNSIESGGKLCLIQKGIICDNNPNTSDFDLYKSIYKNHLGYREYYLNFNSNNKILVKEFKRLQNSFKAFYSKGQLRKAVTGYALPTKGMIKLLNDPMYLGRSNKIRIILGLTRFYRDDLKGERLGNFSIYIVDDNISVAKCFIKCRITPNDGASGSCPPKIPCQ